MRVIVKSDFWLSDPLYFADCSIRAPLHGQCTSDMHCFAVLDWVFVMFWLVRLGEISRLHIIDLLLTGILFFMMLTLWLDIVRLMSSH